MFNLSSKSDHGLLLLTLLSKKKAGRFVPLTEIAEEANLPYAFISRIASQLSKKGILESREGSTGGYRLSKKPKKISVAEVIETLDGPWQPTKCDHEGQACDHQGICPMQNTWQKNLKTKMWQIMENYTIKDLTA